MSPFLRKVTTASGATAVQVVAKQGRRNKVLEHLGSAHSKAELAALMEAGKAKLHAGQGELALDFPAESDPAAVVQSSASRLLIEAITMAWEALGFDDLDDKAFFQLIAARLIEPTSMLDTSRVLDDIGIHLSDTPPLNYENELFYEKEIRSVTSNTRAQGREFLELVEQHGVSATTHEYPMSRALDALQDLKAGRFDGAAVLVNDF